MGPLRYGIEPGSPGRELVVADPDLADPDLANPQIAAARYRALLAELETARAMLDERMQAGRAERIAQAQRHRDAATAIREKVREVWENNLAGSLAHYGLDDLDQLRSTSTGDMPVSSADDGGRPVARVGRRAGRRDDKRLPVRAEPVRPAAVPVDPAHAPQDAYQLCLEAMSRAAELRAVSRGGASASVGMVAGVACVLAGGLTALTRLFADASAFACLGVGALLGWLAVTSLTGAGRGAAVRAGLVAAGIAGMAVLATIHLVPRDPAGVVASMVAIALAIRFGLGFGASQDSGSRSKARGGGQQGRGRAW